MNSQRICLLNHLQVDVIAHFHETVILEHNFELVMNLESAYKWMSNMNKKVYSTKEVMHRLTFFAHFSMLVSRKKCMHLKSAYILRTQEEIIYRNCHSKKLCQGIVAERSKLCICFIWKFDFLRFEEKKRSKSKVHCLYNALHLSQSDWNWNISTSFPGLTIPHQLQRVLQWQSPDLHHWLGDWFSVYHSSQIGM